MPTVGADTSFPTVAGSNFLLALLANEGNTPLWWEYTWLIPTIIKMPDLLVGHALLPFTGLTGHVLTSTFCFDIPIIAYGVESVNTLVLVKTPKNLLCKESA